MKKPDILVYMSDQHSPLFSEWGPVPVDTPNLEDLRKSGTSFSESYTSCPLCVPARMSMLAAKLPSNTGVYTNINTMADTMPTFLHALVADGYETVLMGRMHFIGKDQRHGFTKRLVGDVTPVTWNRPSQQMEEERGVFCNAFMDPYSTDVVGGGESPVLHYDEDVVRAAIDYLKQEHKKPQFILVGTYGPHYPYVAPKERYLKYLERVRVPDTFEEDMKMNPLLELKKKDASVSKETARQAMAAYCGMIEQMDDQIGNVRKVFHEYAKKSGHEAVFCYLSDHGDQVGENRFFGKQTFFEKSAKIPLIFEGKGILAGQSIDVPVSIMDLGPTICELSGRNYPLDTDGRSLAKVLQGIEAADKERSVISQFVANDKDGTLSYGIMVRQGDYKFITYHKYEQFDLLFDLRRDPEERNNLIDKFPEKVSILREIAEGIADPKEQEKIVSEGITMWQWMKIWENETEMDDTERWKLNPPTARELPEVQ